MRQYRKTGLGPTCSMCSEHIPSIESCTCTTVRYGSTESPRIKYGDEDYDWGTRRCGGCGVLKGGYHHENCNREVCPMCGELINLCDCGAEFIF